MARRSSLLVDLGTTYIKVAVLLPDQGLVAETKFPFPPFLSLDGPYRTVNPTDVLAATEIAIASAMPEAKNPQRILLSGQMHGWILTDENNTPLTPLTTWQDNRAHLIRNGIRPIDELRSTQPAALWEAVGNELRSGLPVAGIYASDITALDGHFRLHSLLSWVAAALTRNPSFVQHSSDAAASGMFDLRIGSWSDPITTVVGNNRMLLPKVSPTLEVIGIHSSTGASVFTPVGDQQATLLGAGIRESVTAFNISSGGQVARLATEHAGNRAQTRPFFDGLLLHTQTHLPAGRALTHGIALLSRGIADDDAWYWAAEAAKEHTTRMLPQANLTFHSSTGGGWSGITDAHTSEDLLRALITSMSTAYVAGATNVGLRPGDELLFCGGVAQQFAPLRTAIASTLGRPSKVAPDGDMALRGLAFLASCV